ncbi:MAG: DUF2490 domain-containing protein [Spirosomataceae bacterium]
MWFFVVSVLPYPNFAQNRTDVQAWPGVSLKLDLPKKWTFTVQYRTRLIDNATYYKGSYVFASTEYEFHKHLEAIANYRLAIVDVGIYHRYFLGIAAKAKWGDFGFVLRPAIQYQSQRFTGDDEVRLDADTYLRPRFTVKYKLTKKWDAYVYAEPFFAIGNNKTQIDNWQNSIGFKYEFAKNQKLNPYFIWQPDYSHKKYTLTNYIAGLDIEFSIKPFKKSKSKKNKKGSHPNTQWPPN